MCSELVRAEEDLTTNKLLQSHMSKKHVDKQTQ